MIIEQRNKSLKYPRAIKYDKTMIVLDWLLEFRFSSVEILSQRLGQTTTNANRFFNALFAECVIQRFSNANTKNHRYVMLTSIGLSYLEEAGRDISKATIRVQLLGRYSLIMHDIAVQYAVLRRLNQYQEVIWDRNIALPNHDERPDAILRSPKGYWVAIEYDRWRKDSRRIYRNYINHVRAIKDRHYSGVYYLFNSESDLLHYQSLFDSEHWPLYKKAVGHSGPKMQFKKLQTVFRPDDEKNLRKCFVFSYEPVV